MIPPVSADLDVIVSLGAVVCPADPAGHPLLQRDVCVPAGPLLPRRGREKGIHAIYSDFGPRTELSLVLLYSIVPRVLYIPYSVSFTLSSVLFDKSPRYLMVFNGVRINVG